MGAYPSNQAIVSNKPEGHLLRNSLHISKEQLLSMEKRKTICAVLLNMKEAGVVIDSSNILDALYLVFALNTYDRGTRSAGIIAKTMIKEERDYIQIFINEYKTLGETTSGKLLDLLKVFNPNIPPEAIARMDAFIEVMNSIQTQLTQFIQKGDKPVKKVVRVAKRPPPREKLEKKINDHEKMRVFLDTLSRMYFSTDKKNELKIMNFDRESEKVHIKRELIKGKLQPQNLVLYYRLPEQKEWQYLSFSQMLMDLTEGLSEKNNSGKTNIQKVLDTMGPDSKHGMIRNNNPDITYQVFLDAIEEICELLKIEIIEDE